MFSRLLLLSNRAVNCTLKSFSDIFKDEVAAPVVEEDVHERQRRAAYKAWETRRRRQEEQKAKAAGKQSTISPEILRLDSEVESIAKDTVPNLSWSGFKPSKAGERGVNESGFITPDGRRKMFLKMSTHEENVSEVAAWRVAKAIGWSDVAMPTHMTKFHGQEGIVRDLLPEGKVWRLASDEARAAAKKDSDRLGRVALFEYLINAGDRHTGNYWVDTNNNIWPIDLARSFSTSKYIGGSSAYNQEGVLSSLNKSDVKALIDNKEAIIEAAKFATSFLDYSTGDKGVKRRLDIIEKAYNNARGDKVDVTAHVNDRW